jgi:hypothetical protein
MLNMEKGKLRFGKLAAKYDARTLKMAKYTTKLPLPPESFDNLSIVYDKLKKNNPAELFPMDANDRLGDCVVAGMAHYITIANGRIGELQIPPESDVVKFYKKLSRCGRDEGLVMLDTLKYWRKHQFYNHEIPAFGAIDLKNHILVKQCIQLFGGVDFGFAVQENAIFDFENHIPWTPGNSGGGGHCVVAVAYDKDTVTVLTWGNIQKGTWAWWDAMVDEAFVILPPEASNPDFAPGLDIATLKSDLIEITNNKVEMKSKFLRLNLNDFLKGLLMAFLGALVTGVYQLFQAGSALNWITLKPVLLVAIAAGLSYLIKNLFTNNAGEFAKLDKK